MTESSSSAEKAYFFAVSLPTLNVSSEQLNAFIQNNRYITGWWNHIPQFYILRSSSSLADLNNMFVNFFSGPKVDFIMGEINDTKTQGFLPSSSWQELRESVENHITRVTDNS